MNRAIISFLTGISVSAFTYAGTCEISFMSAKNLENFCDPNREDFNKC